MNEGDDTRLEDWFLRFMLENSQRLEETVGSKLDDFWNVKQENSEILMAQGTGDDGQSYITIYLNIGEGDDKRFVARIQDLIATAGEGEDNYILCIAKEFSSEDIEELMQDAIFFLEKCIYLIFLKIDFKEYEEMNLKDIIKEEVAMKVYIKEY